MLRVSIFASMVTLSAQKIWPRIYFSQKKLYLLCLRGTGFQISFFINIFFTLELPQKMSKRNPQVSECSITSHYVSSF